MRSHRFLLAEMSVLPPALVLLLPPRHLPTALMDLYCRRVSMRRQHRVVSGSLSLCHLSLALINLICLHFLPPLYLPPSTGTLGRRMARSSASTTTQYVLSSSYLLFVVIDFSSSAALPHRRTRIWQAKRAVQGPSLVPSASGCWTESLLPLRSDFSCRSSLTGGPRVGRSARMAPSSFSRSVPTALTLPSTWLTE